MESRPIIQVCYVVEDCQRAAAAWAARVGAGPFFVYRDVVVPDFSDPHGEPVDFAYDNAVGQWGSLMVELMQLKLPPARSRPDPWHELVFHRGLHHMAWFRPDGVDESARLAQHGWPIVATWTWEGRVAMGFNDARQELGCLIEHYPQDDVIVGLYAQVAVAAEGWDGSDPVRGALP